MDSRKLSIAVLGGGPDAEREVSLVSSAAVAEALSKNEGLSVHRYVIDRISSGELASISADVFFPVLHGGFGEGGPLQDLLELDGRPYVGCRPRAARLAMDKFATKLAAHRMGIPAADAAVLNPSDDRCPLALPVVVKPVHEGSSVGLHICRDEAQWRSAVIAVRTDREVNPARVYMIERAIMGGRELTVGMVDNKSLRPIEIVPGEGVYDYQAKYHREDTKYTVGPSLPGGVEKQIRDHSELLCRSMGVRHLARVDFMLDANDVAWMLEVNTMPGFTGHSLLPMAAAYEGMDMTALCTRLVNMAMRDRGDAASPDGGL